MWERCREPRARAAIAAAIGAAAAITDLLTEPRRPRRAAAALAISHLGGMTVLLADRRRAGVRAAPRDLDARIAPRARRSA